MSKNQPRYRDPKSDLLSASLVKVHLLIWLCLGSVTLFLAWSCLMNIDEITRSDRAVVVPSGRSKTVQSLEGGVVKSIGVKEGQMVQKNDVLAELDDRHSVAMLEKNSIQIQALTLKSARLLAEIQQRPFVVDLEHKDLAAANPDSEMEVYHSRQRDLRVKVRLVEDQRSQLSEHLLEATVALEQHKYSHALKLQEYDMTSGLMQHGAISPQEILQLQRVVSEVESQVKQTEHRVKQIREQIYGIDDRIEEVMAQFHKDAHAELNRTKVELDQLYQERISLSDRVARAQLRSPVHGIVNKVYVHTEGGVLRPSETLFDIVPVDDILIIEAKISPKDIGFIHLGMPAQVKITAFDYSLYGGLEGVVESVSPDVFNERDGTYYIARIKTTRSHLERFGQHYPIIPGMAASVDILTGKKTVMSYMLKPILKAKSRAMTER